MKERRLYGACVLAGKCVCGICEQISPKEMARIMADMWLETQMYMDWLDSLDKKHHNRDGMNE